MIGSTIGQAERAGTGRVRHINHLVLPKGWVDQNPGSDDATTVQKGHNETGIDNIDKLRQNDDSESGTRAIGSVRSLRAPPKYWQSQTSVGWLAAYLL
jgi:hypothetical protein